MGHRSVVQWGHGSVEITRVSCTLDHGSAVQWVTGSVVQWITVQLYNGSQVSGNDPGQLHNGSWVSCTMGHSLTGQSYNGSWVSCTMGHRSVVQWVTGSVVQWITVQLYNGSQVSGNDPGQLHNGSWVRCTMGHSLTGQLYNGSGVSGNDPLSRVTTKCYQYCKDQHRIRNCKAKLSLQSLGVQLPMDGLAIRFVSRFSTSKNVF